MGFSIMADQTVWLISLSRGRKWTRVTKCTHSRRDYDASESESMLSIWSKYAYQHYMALVQDPDFSIYARSLSDS